MTKTTFEFQTDIDIAEFISKRAHGLRSPYNHVVGFTKIVLNGQSGPLTDLQKEDLSISYKSAMRTLWVMNNLIDMARLSRKKRSLNLSDVDANQMLDEVIDHWKKYNYGDTSTIACMVLANPPRIKADESLVRQVISNFITYVKEYLQPNSNVTISVEDDHEGWLFTVEATGDIKDLHSELDLEMTGYVCQKYLELAGGKIRMGEAGDGKATVKFILPVE
jgi:signal transduction histidine kinase